MKTLFFILLFVQICIAETKYFLALNINEKTTLVQLDEALQLGIELRQSIAQLEKIDPKSANLPILREKLLKFQNQLQKTYGLYPGLNYKMVPTSGTIYQLIPVTEEKKEIKSENVIVTKNSSGEDVRCIKKQLIELKDSDSVAVFNQTLMTVQSVKRQIADFENQFKAKPELLEKPELQVAMNKLKASLLLMEAKLLEQFQIQSDGKYSFEPQTGAVYLVLDENELQKLSDMNQGK